METTVRQRLIEYLKYKGIGRNKFESMAGLSFGYITKLKNAPGAEKLVDILHVAPDLNKIWLLTGEGSMLTETKPPEASRITDAEHVRVPLVHQYAYAGFLTGFGDPEYMETLPTVDFTPDREMTGNWLAFEVRGESMDDGSREAYCQGDIVICREVEPHLWRDYRLHYNRRDYVIVHQEGILIKRIIAHDIERHTITVHSLNPTYPDKEIDLAEVRQLYSIVESRQNRAR